MGVKISSKGDIPITAINNRFLFPSPKVKDSEIINAHILTQNMYFDVLGESSEFTRLFKILMHLLSLQVEHIHFFRLALDIHLLPIHSMQIRKSYLYDILFLL